MKSRKLLVLSAIIVAGSAFMLAQSQPNLENGFKPYGSYDGGNIDAVNLMNGNLILRIPMPFSYPQRGGNFNPQDLLTISSKQWINDCQPVDAQGDTACYWDNGGVQAVIATAGQGLGFDISADMALTRTLVGQQLNFGAYNYGTSAYALNTADGAKHQLMQLSANPTWPAEPLSMETMDTSGFHIDFTSFDNTKNGTATAGVITDRRGNRYTFGGFGGPCSGGIVDPNGNATTTCIQAATGGFSSDPNGNSFTGSADMLGRAYFSTLYSYAQATNTSDYSGCVGNGSAINSATVLQYTSYNGTSNTIKQCFVNLTVQTNFSTPGSHQFGPGVEQFLATLVMPDGSNWNFQYDSYGNVTRIGLPLGSSISYTWGEIGLPTCGTNTFVSRAVLSRTVNDDNGDSFVWNYSWGTPSNGTITNTVNDALHNDTVHVFTALDGPSGCNFFETATSSYQGAKTSGQLLEHVDTQFSGTGYNVVPTIITTTVYPSGKMKQVTKAYDTGLGASKPIFGNVVTEKEYDWGQGSPGGLLRETDTTYRWQNDSRYLTAHLLDLPASVVVKDGGGCALAETDYTYDESAYLTAYETTVGTLPAGTHVAAPNLVRGNPTTVTKWLAAAGSCNPKGGTAVISHTNWYDTGEAYKSTDPLNHTTVHSYDLAYAGAYATQTCSPQTGMVTHCVSGTYDFTTGLLSTFTNENATTQASGNAPGDSGHTTSYAYDFMSRMTSATFPPDPNNSSAQAVTQFTYPVPLALPFAVTRTKSITSGLSDSITTTLDGLGRPYKSVHGTAGNATVVTQYDGLDHVISVTNPYFSTSDPTYGVIQTQYDALGRVTQVTEQDGGIRSSAYDVSPVQAVNGDCTTSTDEAGKQRLSCSDALGRLTEVHETGDNFNGTDAGGALNVGGSLQTYIIPSTSATQGKASIAINGSEQSVTTNNWYCAQYDENGDCVDWENMPVTVYDSGTMGITVNGRSYSYNYGGSDAPSTIATSLANAMNADGGAFVTASVSGGTLNLTSKSAGSATNYSFSTSYSYDTYDFPSASFWFTPASGNLTGGADGTSPTTVYDAGTVTVTIGSFSASASYGQSGNNTAALVAAALAGSGPNGLSRSGSPVTATASAGTITINYGTVGPAGNGVSLSCSSSTSQGAYFSSPSFACPSSTALSGGYNPEGPSLDFNYFVTQYAYDGLGNLLTVTQKGDPTVTSSSQWRVRNFTYDSLGRLLTAQNPESGTISYSYDSDGNLLQKTSPVPNQTGSATQTISYCYDALNRMTGRAYTAQTCPLSSPAVSYAYDSGANGIGHLTSLTDQAGSASYTYDVLGRMSGESRAIAGATKSLSYGYNLDGSLQTLTYPSGATVTYAVDSAGRDVSAIDSGNGINYVSLGNYQADGQITGFTSGNSGGFAGITHAFSYNKRLQPINMSAASSSATVFSINYDFHLGAGDNGNVWGITNNKDNTRGQAFTYDSLNRLTSGQNAGTDCTKNTVNGKTEYWGNSYGYDAWGNLLSKSVTKCSAENLSVTAATNNQLQGGYTYDAAGNMTHDATANLNYSYDAENRITGAAGYTYTYDDDGNRVEKANGSTGTLYWYMSPGIVGESDLSGNLTAEYVFFDGERVARKDFPGNAVSYYFSDHLKTTDIVTDAQGNIKNESDFYPWGGELQFLANDSNHYKFTGKERDSETGLDYFGARYYSNGLGRFITPDWSAVPVPVPYADLSDPQTFNQYGYVRNLPTTRFDADGHCDWCKKVWESLAIGVDKGARMLGTKIGGPAYGEAVATMDIAGNKTFLAHPKNMVEQIGMAVPGAVITVSLAGALGAAGEAEAGAVKPYEVGTYGELSSRSVVGDGLTLDHIPSNASNLARAEAAKGGELSEAERLAVRDQGTAVAVPDAAHRSASPTYGGRNTQAQVQADATNPQAAAARDTQAMVNAASANNKAAAKAAANKICQAAECK